MEADTVLIHNNSKFNIMQNINTALADAIQRTIEDIRVETAERFLENFRKEGFFGSPWKRRKKGAKRDKGRALLVDTGNLRRSINSRTTADSVEFYTDVPYAAIHNEGGKLGRGRGTMPQRQFIGDHPELEQAITEIIKENLRDFLEDVELL